MSKFILGSGIFISLYSIVNIVNDGTMKAGDGFHAVMLVAGIYLTIVGADKLCKFSAK